MIFAKITLVNQIYINFLLKYTFRIYKKKALTLVKAFQSIYKHYYGKPTAVKASLVFVNKAAAYFGL